MATRRPGKPHPVQGQAGTLTLPAESQVGRRARMRPFRASRGADGWLLTTESGLPASYGRGPALRGFSHSGGRFSRQISAPAGYSGHPAAGLAARSEQIWPAVAFPLSAANISPSAARPRALPLDQGHDVCDLGPRASTTQPSSTTRAASAPSPICRASARHDTVRRALEVLDRLEHRGASGAEIDTGDGAGILLQIPDEFLRAVASASSCPSRAATAWACCFLPREDDAPRARSSS